MAVFVDMLGGPTFPPKGTQVRDFGDNFVRPDAGTLGSAWGVMWLYADYPYDAANRPVPQNTAISPKIKNNQCVWFSRRDDPTTGGPYIQAGAYSTAWPWPLAWMTQAVFPQYVEARIDFSDLKWGNAVMLNTVFSGNAGSLDPDIYKQGPPLSGRYGFYSLDISRQGWSNISYNVFGSNPSTTPTGLRGHAGVNYIALISQSFDASVDPWSLFRFEARPTPDGWKLQGFQNGNLFIEATDNRLLQGMPGMGCSTAMEVPQGESGPDPNDVGHLRDFRAGMLPGGPISGQRAIS